MSPSNEASSLCNESIAKVRFVSPRDKPQRKSERSNYHDPGKPDSTTPALTATTQIYPHSKQPLSAKRVLTGESQTDASKRNGSIPLVPELSSRGSTPSSEELEDPASVSDVFRPELFREPIDIELERVTIVRFPTPVDEFSNAAPAGRQGPLADSTAGPSHPTFPPEPRTEFTFPSADLDPLPGSPFSPENPQFRKMCADLLRDGTDLRISLEEAERGVRAALEGAIKAKLELKAESKAMETLLNHLKGISGRDVVDDIIKKAAIVAEEGSDVGWGFEDQEQASVRSDNDQDDDEGVSGYEDFDQNQPSESESVGGSYESPFFNKHDLLTSQALHYAAPIVGSSNRKITSNHEDDTEVRPFRVTSSLLENDRESSPHESGSSISPSRKRSRDAHDNGSSEIDLGLSGSRNGRVGAGSYKRRRTSRENSHDDTNTTSLLEQPPAAEQPIIIEQPQSDANTNTAAQNTTQVGNPLRRDRERLRETNEGSAEVYFYEQDPDWLWKMNRHRVTMEKLSKNRE